MDAKTLSEKLSQVELSGDGADLFAQHFANNVMDLVKMMLTTLEDDPQVDVSDQLAKRVDFWIQRFNESAYRELADSINKSYSHMVGRIEDQARAAAYKEVADQLATFRDYGSFSIRMLRHKP